MRARTFWRAMTVDEPGLLDRLLAMLAEESVAFCLVGGQAVNAYVEPLVSLDCDLVVAAQDLARIESRLAAEFRVERHPHTLNVGLPDSDLRVQFQLDPRYAPFVGRAQPREVLGLLLPVADLHDLLQGKAWAATDPRRRASKRQKDLADLARLVEAFPELAQELPAAVRALLLS